MAVVTLTTTKGGAGKTTAALLLGTILADQGAKVAILDADPNQPVARWGKRGGVPQGLTIVGDLGQDTIQEAIEEYRAKAQFVIVDLEGSANLTTAYALMDTDLALVPMQASTLDVDEAMKTLAHIQRQTKSSGRGMVTRLLWQKMPPAYVTKATKDFTEQFEAAGLVFMATRLIDREAFRSILNYGLPLDKLDSTMAPSLDKAKQNALAFVHEVVELLKEAKR